MSYCVRIRFARQTPGLDVDMLPGDLVEEVDDLPTPGQRFWRGRPHRVWRVEGSEPATIVLVPDLERVEALSRRLPQGYQLEVQRDIDTGVWRAMLHADGLRLYDHADPDDPDAAVEAVLERAGL